MWLERSKDVKAKISEKLVSGNGSTQETDPSKIKMALFFVMGCSPLRKRKEQMSQMSSDVVSALRWKVLLWLPGSRKVGKCMRRPGISCVSGAGCLAPGALIHTYTHTISHPHSYTHPRQLSLQSHHQPADLSKL